MSITNASNRTVEFVKTATLEQLERVIYDVLAQSGRWSKIEKEEIAGFFNDDTVPGFYARVSGNDDNYSITDLAVHMTIDDAERVIHAVLARLRTTAAATQTELMSVLNEDQIDEYLVDEYYDDAEDMNPVLVPAA